jgi:hypothetical protein
MSIFLFKHSFPFKRYGEMKMKSEIQKIKGTRMFIRLFTPSLYFQIIRLLEYPFTL